MVNLVLATSRLVRPIQTVHYNTKILIECRFYKPGIVASLGVITDIIEQPSEVDKNGAWCVRCDQVCLHLLGRRKWGDDYRSLFQAHMVLLPKCLNQRCLL